MVYSHLRRLGFIVRRHRAPWISEFSKGASTFSKGRGVGLLVSVSGDWGCRGGIVRLTTVRGLGQRAHLILEQVRREKESIVPMWNAFVGYWRLYL